MVDPVDNEMSSKCYGFEGILVCGVLTETL